MTEKRGPKAKLKEIKECPVCGMCFEVSLSRKNKKFCGRACMGISKRVLLPIKNCSVCGSFFRPTRSERPEKTCSKKCSHIIKTGRNNKNPWLSKNCLNCGKEFSCKSYSDKSFCCHLCSEIYRVGDRNPFYGKKHPEGMIKYLSEIKRTGRYSKCSCGCEQDIYVPKLAEKLKRHYVNKNHMTYHLRGAEHYAYCGGAEYYWRGKDWKEIKNKVRERDIICTYCSKTKEENGRNLSVHHIIPWRQVQNSSIDNLICLCNSCHTKETLKEIKIFRQHKIPPVMYTKDCVICDQTFNSCNPHKIICLDISCKEKYRRLRHTGMSQPSSI